MNNHKIPSRRQAKPGKPLPSKKQKQTKLKTKEKNITNTFTILLLQNQTISRP